MPWLLDKPALVTSPGFSELLHNPVLHPQMVLQQIPPAAVPNLPPPLKFTNPPPLPELIVDECTS